MQGWSPGKIFFLLKHFYPNHRLHKICNCNVIKLSYSCTPNMVSFISAHDKNLLNNKDDDSPKKPCNSRDKARCPIPESCRNRETRVECIGSTRICNGLCKTKYKAHFYNHVQSFKSCSKSKATKFSKFIWNCKDSGIEPSITWKTICHANHMNEKMKKGIFGVQLQLSLMFLLLMPT